MTCECGYSSQSEANVDGFCPRCGEVVHSTGWHGVGRDRASSGAGSHMSPTSLSRGHSIQHEDDEACGAEADAEPSEWLCKAIVVLCGMATFARTEAILLQTVFFAECESYAQQIELLSFSAHTCKADASLVNVSLVADLSSLQFYN